MPDHTLAIVFRNLHPQRNPDACQVVPASARRQQRAYRLPWPRGFPSGGADRAKAMNTANRCYYPFGRRA
jgi:hypothetical protein